MRTFRKVPGECSLNRRLKKEMFGQAKKERIGGDDRLVFWFFEKLDPLGKIQQQQQQQEEDDDERKDSSVLKCGAHLHGNAGGNINLLSSLMESKHEQIEIKGSFCIFRTQFIPKKQRK